MPNEYTSAYAPMQSNAQYQQPQIMGQGSQEAMHNAMLQQQQQYNNQSANIAGQPSGLSNFLAPVQRMMMAQALRQGGNTDSNFKGDNTYFGSNSTGMGAGEMYSGMNADIGLK
jgi:hypothetical protein